MAANRKRRRPMAQMNVVPYIDVMLVLLVIFMVTTPLLQEGIEIDLPQATSTPIEPTEDETKRIVVAVSPEGDMFLDEDGKEALPLTVDELTRRISELLLERDNKTVYVRGDTTSQYGAVVQAMAYIQQAGSDSIGLITEPEDK